MTRAFQISALSRVRSWDGRAPRAAARFVTEEDEDDMISDDV
jgi:hypothetical protein